MKQTNNMALITGASSGIGLAYANEMAKRGYNLLIVSNEEEKINQAAIEISIKFKVEVIPLFMNLAMVDAAEKVYHYCKENQLVIDVLINNAGMFLLDELVRLDSKKIEDILLLHVVTPTKLCQQFGRDMKQRNYGYILNMSSLSAWMPYPGLNLYASSKIYLKSFSKALRQEMKDYNVSVTMACPGAIATDLYHLSHKLQNIAVNLGFMMRPEKFARLAIKKMLRKKAMILPGFMNYLMIPLFKLVPVRAVRIIMRKTKLLPITK